MDQLVTDITTLQTTLTAVQTDVQALATATPVVSTDPNDAVVSAFVRLDSKSSCY